MTKLTSFDQLKLEGWKTDEIESRESDFVEKRERPIKRPRSESGHEEFVLGESHDTCFQICTLPKWRFGSDLRVSFTVNFLTFYLQKTEALEADVP